MKSSELTGIHPERSTRVDMGAAVTRSLLGYGVLAGPFYLTVGVIQGWVRDGFDFARHPLSVLVNGPGGWVQTANFVLTGLMVIAAAVGFARMPAPRLRAVAGWLALYGVSMIVAAAFPADPMDGFPIGTPVGMPTTISSAGMSHFAAGGVGFLALAVSGLVAARAMSRRQARVMSRLSLGAGLSVLLGFFGGFIPGVSLGTAGIWFAVVVGWAWLALLSVHLYRVSPDPRCAA